VASLGGHPLLAWTINTAKDSSIFNKIVVSSEDEEIGKIAEFFGANWHVRDPSLAKDDTPSMDVLLDVVVHEELFENQAYDVIALLQPTSPFRTTEDIKGAFDLLLKTKGDSVVSVTKAPNDLAFDVRFAQRLLSLPNVVVPNGAIYLITAKALQDEVGWYGNFAYGYEMPKDRSLDIDTEQDLEIARMIVEKQFDTSK
jgi:CMP-N-acetylneuraminic acid synthetase